MNKAFFTKLLLSSLLIYSLSFTMNNTSATTIKNIMDHIDIRPIITRQLSQNDYHDTRLVCRAWAPKDRNWYYMPNRVEEEYDKIIRKKNKIGTIDKEYILFACTAQNNLKAVKWILSTHTTNINKGINVEYNTNKFKIDASMLAIHNNNLEVAHLLIEPITKNNNQDWKHLYKTTTVPQYLQHYSDNNNNDRDFSFVFYFTATSLDDASLLKKMYNKKEINQQGHKFLIDRSYDTKAIDCFKFLLKNKPVKQIIKNKNFSYFQQALNTLQKDFPQALIKNKLFKLNKVFWFDKEKGTYHGTILDYYYNNKTIKNCDLIIKLLIKLGAIKNEQSSRKEKILKIPLSYNFPNMC